jgi:uncharacterized damage-inducible protein DinB
MNLTPNNIDEIYEQNAAARSRLLELLKTVSPGEEQHYQPGGWTIAHVAEHVAIVDEGMSRLCARLVRAAREGGIEYSGGPLISQGFRDNLAAAAGKKVEAPDQVKPTGEVSIAASIERLAAGEAAFETLREDMARYDLSNHHFPHPYFGPLTASEWLLMAGLHASRHTAQIERMLADIRK